MNEKNLEFDVLDKYILSKKIRPLVRDILFNELNSSKEFKGFVSANINRGLILSEIKGLIEDVMKNEISDLIKKNLKYEVFRLAEVYLKDKLDELDLSKEVKKHIVPHLKQNFKGVITICLDSSQELIRKKINSKLMDLINLKTSTIQEIKRLVDIPVDREESLSFLKIEFPEYYEEIKLIGDSDGE